MAVSHGPAAGYPAMGSISPTSVPYNVETWLTVNGTGFQSGFTAAAEGFSIAAAGLQSISANQVRVSVKMAGNPAGYAATLRVTNPGGQSATGTFQVQPAPGPTIGSTSPGSVRVNVPSTLATRGHAGRRICQVEFKRRYN